jgi:hypothetical protein
LVNIIKFQLAPMGVLAPGSAHTWHSARPPIDTEGNISRNPSNISPNPLLHVAANAEHLDIDLKCISFKMPKMCKISLFYHKWQISIHYASPASHPVILFLWCIHTRAHREIRFKQWSTISRKGWKHYKGETKSFLE